MRVGVVGVNHKLASLELREKLARACVKHFGLRNKSHSPHTFILLSTCNRTEVYFHSEEELSQAHTMVLDLLKPDECQELEQKLYSFFGTCCFHHLCRVTAGMDSAILAETEIQGQVKKAYLRATAQGTLPSDLHYLFQKALKVGKTVRRSYDIPTAGINLEKMIYQTGLQHFCGEDLGSLLLVGASEINAKILNYLAGKELKSIAICNRSTEHGMQLATKFGVEALPWSNLSNWKTYDWVIFGTSAPEPLLKADEARQSHQKHLIIDLSVPRNVDPDVGICPTIELWNIDQINRRIRDSQQKLRKALFSAEMALSKHTERLVYSYRRHSSSPPQVVNHSELIVV